MGLLFSLALHERNDGRKTLLRGCQNHVCVLVCVCVGGFVCVVFSLGCVVVHAAVVDIILQPESAFDAVRICL